MTLRPDPHTEIREALGAMHSALICGEPWTATLARVTEAALAANFGLEREAAERETALVCSWCGDEFESDGAASNCCSCDPVPASSLPSLLKDARREAEELNEAGWKEQGAAEARVREVEAERDKLKDALREIATLCRFEDEHTASFASLRELAVKALASPEAPAAEPPRDWKTPLGSIEPTKRHLLSKTYFERYFLGVSRDRPESEVEVTQDEFVRAENAAGFRPKPGCGPTATGGFVTGGSYGRAESFWPAAALPAVDAPPEPTT